MIEIKTWGPDKSVSIQNPSKQRLSIFTQEPVSVEVRCRDCGQALRAHWRADHVISFARCKMFDCVERRKR